MKIHKLSRYDAEVITDDKETADYFESLIRLTSSYKAAANWLLGPVKSYLNEKGISISDFPLKPELMASLINLVEEGRVIFQQLLPGFSRNLSAGKGTDPLQLAISMNLIQTDDQAQILEWVNRQWTKCPTKCWNIKRAKKDCWDCLSVK